MVRTIVPAQCGNKQGLLSYSAGSASIEMTIFTDDDPEHPLNVSPTGRPHHHELLADA